MRNPKTKTYFLTKACFWFKRAIAGLRQFLATESHLKMIKMLFISS